MQLAQGKVNLRSVVWQLFSFIFFHSLSNNQTISYLIHNQLLYPIGANNERNLMSSLSFLDWLLQDRRVIELERFLALWILLCYKPKNLWDCIYGLLLHQSTDNRWKEKIETDGETVRFRSFLYFYLISLMNFWSYFHLPFPFRFHSIPKGKCMYSFHSCPLSTIF